MNRRLSALAPRRIIARYRHWLVPFATLGFGQVAATGLNALFMLVLLRLASKADFAIYSLFTNMHNTMTGFSDLGLTSAIVAIGARHRGEEVYGVLAMIRRFRTLLFLLGVGMSAGLLLHLIQQERVGALAGTLWFLIVACGAWTAVAITVQSSLLNLFERYSAIAMVNPIIAATRLAGLALQPAMGAGVGFLLVIGALSQIAGYIFIRLKNGAIPRPKLTPEQRERIRREILLYTRPLVFSSILFYLQPTIVLWLLNYLGSSQEVADFSAVGSLSRILAVISTATNAPLLSRFSKIEDRDHLVRLFAKVTVMQVSIVAVVLLSGWMFPGTWLWLLGRNYGGLDLELFHFFVGWGFTYLAGFFITVLTSRSRTVYQAHVLAAALAVQLAYAAVADVSSARQAFIMNNIYLGAFAFGQAALVYFLLVRRERRSSRG